MSQRFTAAGFSLVEVVTAMGIVSFAVLATFGLLSVANDTSKNARDEGLAARLAANEFSRLRSLSTNFPERYDTRFFDESLTDRGTVKQTALGQGAKYEFRIQSPFPAAPDGTGDYLLNAEVRFPIAAREDNQTVYRFTAIVNNPAPTPPPAP